MKRRSFIKALGALAVVPSVPKPPIPIAKDEALYHHILYLERIMVKGMMYGPGYVSVSTNQIRGID